MKEIKYKPASSAGAGCAGSCKIGSTPPELPLKRHVLFYEVMQDLQDLGSSYGPTQREQPLEALAELPTNSQQNLSPDLNSTALHNRKIVLMPMRCANCC